jgi:hypothetical protein
MASRSGSQGAGHTLKDQAKHSFLTPMYIVANRSQTVQRRRLMVTFTVMKYGGFSECGKAHLSNCAEAGPPGIAALRWWVARTEYE